MSNTLTGLIPTIYQAADMVGRELVGFIPAVYKNSSAARAAKDETIRYPIVPAISLEAISAGATPADSGDATIGYADMTISKSYAAPVRWDGEETLGVKNSGQYEAIMRDRFAQAFRALCNSVEADLAGTYKYASRAYGSSGVTPFATSFSDAAQMLKILDDNGCPATGRNLVIDTAAALNMRSLSNFSVVSSAGSDAGLRRGVLAPLYGFDIRQSAQVALHAAGTVTGTDVNFGAGYDVGDTAIVTHGSDAGTIAAGDWVTWAGDTNKYLVTSATGSGASVTLVNLAKPGLRAALADATEMTINTTNYRANLAFHSDAIHLITRAPALPDGGDSAFDSMMVTDPVSGLTFEVRAYSQYRRVKYEVCLAWGVKMVKPEFAAVLLG